MHRIAINPWTWSLNLGYNQGEVITAARRQLYISGQTSIDDHGTPKHPDDMRAQMELALDNLQQVVTQAEMRLSNLVQLTLYATDVDQVLSHFDLLKRLIGPADAAPPMSLLGVTRLALPPLMFEISAIAAD